MKYIYSKTTLSNNLTINNCRNCWNT